MSLLLLGHRATRTTLSARVGACTLTTRGQVHAVAQATVALEILKTLNVHTDLVTKVTFDLVVLLDIIADATDLFFSHVIGARGIIKLRPGDNFLRAGAADTEDIS